VAEFRRSPRPRRAAPCGGVFRRPSEVDLLYGHRLIIDEEDREVARWIMPRHDAATLEWIDYVPQETMFWRKRAWDRVGGIDPTFQFALDWDLLARFQQPAARWCACRISSARSACTRSRRPRR
jgi:hypothetical protein